MLLLYAHCTIIYCLSPVPYGILDSFYLSLLFFIYIGASSPKEERIMFNEICGSAVGFAAIVTSVPVTMAGAIAKGMAKLDNYQERDRAARRMKINMIRRQYGQPALK